MNQKKLNRIFMIAAIVFAVIAVVLLVVGIVYNAKHLFTKIVVIFVAIASLVLAAEFTFMILMSNVAPPNYFLYDSRSKKNIPVEKLSFQVVNNRMNRYFAGYASSESKLWTDGVLDDDNVDITDEFKPLVGYKLLFDLAQMDKENVWSCFETASDKTVDFICAGIELNGEAEIAKNLRLMKAAKPFQIKYVRDYLMSNKSYIQTKMMRYVRDNIEKFQ